MKSPSSSWTTQGEEDEDAVINPTLPTLGNFAQLHQQISAKKENYVNKMLQTRQQQQQQEQLGESRDQSDRRRLLAEAEDPGVSQAERGDGGLRPQRGLVVAVPADAVVTIAVQVAQQRVEAAAARCRHRLAQADQQGVPLRQSRKKKKGVLLKGDTVLQ